MAAKVAPVWEVSVYLDSNVVFTEPLYMDMALEDFKSHITRKVQTLGVHDFYLSDLSNALIPGGWHMINNNIDAVKIQRVRHNTVQESSRRTDFF
ncbi:Hypp1194 [Branchiostoma lanceolatum]|uniref:Hypp1194 protein n=1 Tax=Branchiostoma lanceolatum TaxID=7740 RepID=A0A8J9ZH30_BRALA|nr:Hypp1194 [Branchiostoma lanceolatum]